jgi:ferredoxin-NADP reductase/MOSC domain-containing protein YiiM
MRVLSINAGPLQPLSVQCEVIKTGFYKGPCEGAVRVAQIGIEGDARVACATDLNRAVFFYQASYYDQLRSELGRDLPYGTIGENVTFDGPDDKSFFLGDLLRIGSTVLRVTQPRFPCRKLTARMHEGDDFPLRYLKSGRLGFFCNVVEEGTMSAGDPISLVHREADPYPLTEFARVTFLEPRDADGLRRMLSCPVLVPEWRIRVERTLRRALGAEGWSDYRPLNVVRRHAESLDTVSLDLEDPTGEMLPDFIAGQFVTLRLDVPGEGNPIVRTYTINGRSASGRGYSIAVKRIAEGDGNGFMTGTGSSYLNSSVREGDALAALPPRGLFMVEPGARPIALLSAGIGVTPMTAMLEQLATCPLGREVYFIHGARSGHEHVFDARIRTLTTGSNLLRRFVKYSRPSADDIEGHDFDAAGRVTIDDVVALIPSLEADFYVCGPVAFMRDIIRGLVDRGVPKDRIRYEFFGQNEPLFDEPAEAADSSEPAMDAGGKPIIVTFARSGVSVPWTKGAFSILSLAEQRGLRLANSCRTGLCSVCVCRLDAGEVTYAVEPIEPPAEGEVMICCAQPTTSVMLNL